MIDSISNPMVKRSFLWAVVCALLLPATCLAQDYPTKPVRVLVPFVPGAATDVQARLIGSRLQENLGQTFVIENRAGAGGQIAAETAARATPDGYTIFFVSSALAIKTALGEMTTFDVVKDLAPIAGISLQPLFLIVNTGVSVKSVPELVAIAKKQSRPLNSASAGSGTLGHLTIELFNQMAGIKVTHVPYKGGNMMMTALLTGDIDFNFQGAVAAVPVMRTGKVRALAITSLKRSPVAPDLPTMDSFYPGFEMVNWFALFAPSGVPASSVAKLSAATRKELGSPQVETFLAREGLEVFDRTPAELGKHFKNEVARYTKVIQTMNVRGTK